MLPIPKKDGSWNSPLSCVPLRRNESDIIEGLNKYAYKSPQKPPDKQSEELFVGDEVVDFEAPVDATYSTSNYNSI